MTDILEIEFKGHRKEFAVNPLQFPFMVGDPAIVAVERGHDLGKVSHLGWRPGFASEQQPALSVVRRARHDDLNALESNRQRESDARNIARQKIAAHKLEMKLVDVELQWDGKKMTFYFTADGRVDFRELVKDLASTFRTRIDLRQIGARDETKRTGGYGICGRPLCCASFLTEFKPITTQMPRDQFLPLNPSKLSGVCGRLKCCLRYELDVYREFQRACPKIGQPVKEDNKGDGVVEKLDLIREQIHVRYTSGELERFGTDEFQSLSDWKPETPKSDCVCICGRKAQPTPAKKPEQIEDESSQPEPLEGAERVTLLAGGGIGLKTGMDGAEVQVGTEQSVTPSTPQPKKKRKRRHKRRSGGPQGSTSTPEPQTDD